MGVVSALPCGRSARGPILPLVAHRMGLEAVFGTWAHPGRTTSPCTSCCSKWWHTYVLVTFVLGLVFLLLYWARSNQASPRYLALWVTACLRCSYGHTFCSTKQPSHLQVSGSCLFLSSHRSCTMDWHLGLHEPPQYCRIVCVSFALLVGARGIRLPRPTSARSCTSSWSTWGVASACLGPQTC